MSATLELAKALIARSSVTPNDGGCQELIAARLEKLGFVIEPMQAGGVTNLWARRGNGKPVFAFAGHTDVVPTGPESAWRFPPFQPTVVDNVLYGRGAADMKGGLAAMITATEAFLANTPDPSGDIAFLITSDEEGPATHGTRHVIETLQRRGEAIDYCVVGEPSSRERVGDVVRVGRRGSLNGVLSIRGVQGHVAYPELADNPIHRAVGLLETLAGRRWDEGFETFPATSFQISNIQSGTGAENVIPGSLEARFNFRYSPAQTAEALRHEVESLLQRQEFDWHIDWRESGRPFFTPEGPLRHAVEDAIETIQGFTPQSSTGGGTSDGRFIAPTGAQVVELGVCNDTIHQINECVRVEELDQLSKLYERVLEGLLQKAI